MGLLDDIRSKLQAGTRTVTDGGSISGDLIPKAGTRVTPRVAVER